MQRPLQINMGHEYNYVSHYQKGKGNDNLNEFVAQLGICKIQRSPSSPWAS